MCERLLAIVRTCLASKEGRLGTPRWWWCVCVRGVAMGLAKLVRMIGVCCACTVYIVYIVRRSAVRWMGDAPFLGSGICQPLLPRSV